jgi:hypothetical protein
MIVFSCLRTVPVTCSQGNLPKRRRGLATLCKWPAHVRFVLPANSCNPDSGSKVLGAYVFTFMTKSRYRTGQRQ